MRILHLTPELPYAPGGTGGSTRQFHLLRRLVRKGHEVSVVAPVTGAQAHGAERLRSAGVELHALQRPPSRFREALGALVHEPRLVPRVVTEPLHAWQTGVFWSRMRADARRLVADWKPEVVTIEHDHAAGWLADLPEVRAVIVFQNVSWHYWQSRAAAAAGVRRLAFGLEARRFRRYDRRALPRFDEIVAVSPRDRDDIEAEIGRRAYVVPNGVAIDELRPAPPSSERETVIFTGTMNYPPNREAILWFAQHVWPRVLAERPQARLLVVGREPPADVRALAGDGVEVTGGVPDVAPWFARATAVVAPLRSGGGTRLKVLEALASGRALVSTRVGAEGLELEDGVELLLEDEPEAFAAGVLRLLSDEELRRRMAEAGRLAVERRYSWEMLGDELEAVLETVVRQPSPGEHPSESEPSVL